MKRFCFSRFVCLILVAMMILPMAVSCAETGTENETTASSAETKVPTTTEEVVVTESPYDEEGYLKDSIPETLKFGNEEVVVLHWNDADYEEFFAAGENGEIVNDAIYKRNCNVEDRLDIQLTFTGTAGDTNNEAPFANFLSNSISAGEKVYDIVGAYSYTAGLCAVQNLYYDMTEVKYLDYEKPWWPSNLIEQSTINNKIYFISGDISANCIYAMYVIFFNKTLQTEFNIENPYQYALDGKWTLDKMMELATGIYSDTNGNGTKDVGDRAGLYAYTLHLDPFLWGSDIFIIDSTEGKFELSEDYLGEKTYQLQQKLKNFFEKTDDGIHHTIKADNHKYFGEGLALFIPERCHRAIPYSEAGVDFGVLPVPKYDEAQQDYITIMGNTFSLYSMPADVVDPDLSAAVIECMASESYRTIVPALYERSFQYRYSKEEVSAQMFDIAKGSVVFDMARIFSNSLGAYKAWQGAIRYATAWTTTVDMELRMWKNQIEKILVSFK
jgi:hypothetical protein